MDVEVPDCIPVISNCVEICSLLSVSPNCVYTESEIGLVWRATVSDEPPVALDIADLGTMYVAILSESMDSGVMSVPAIVTSWFGNFRMND